MRISNERERFCLAGAMAAPEGVDAAVPVDLWTSAAAAPLGCCGVASAGFLSAGGAGVCACAITEGASGSGDTLAGAEILKSLELELDGGGPAAKAESCKLKAQPVKTATVLQNLRVIKAPADN
jgi:hypothetical protein